MSQPNAWEENTRRLRESTEKLEAAAKRLVKLVGKNNPRKVLSVISSSRGVLIIYGDGESINIEAKGKI